MTYVYVYPVLGKDLVSEPQNEVEELKGERKPELTATYGRAPA